MMPSVDFDIGEKERVGSRFFCLMSATRFNALFPWKNLLGKSLNKTLLLYWVHVAR